MSFSVYFMSHYYLKEVGYDTLSNEESEGASESE